MPRVELHAWPKTSNLLVARQAMLALHELAIDVPMMTLLLIVEYARGAERTKFKATPMWLSAMTARSTSTFETWSTVVMAMCEAFHTWQRQWA
jgi:hypothetical protein